MSLNYSWETFRQNFIHFSVIYACIIFQNLTLEIHTYIKGKIVNVNGKSGNTFIFLHLNLDAFI
jgi:hypothetical protein